MAPHRLFRCTNHLRRRLTLGRRQIRVRDLVTACCSGPVRSVAEAARLVGLSTHTLRYYEQERLVRPARNASGYREYSASDLRRLVFLTRMRLSGMTMTDLKRYISLVEQGPEHRHGRRRIMRDQHDRITRQIRELRLALETTEYKICVYDGHPEG
ncbi:MerR family transcriptional regulator [Micromonospora zamorensis]|uniref:MerR family transcriptional regulator n=1 Tax=Micromonospora zamorensis TaxID=709883 RepID=UPI0033E5ED8C